MPARLFDSPLTLLLILAVILLLFGAPKLPGMARSLGQSMRIFKSEVKEMKKDGEDSNVTVDGEPVSDGQNISTAGTQPHDNNVPSGTDPVQTSPRPR